MEEIKSWLESQEKDYQVGLQLLAPRIKNRMLLNTLMRKESDYNRQKLAYELSKLVPAEELEADLEEPTGTEGKPTNTPEAPCTTDQAATATDIQEEQKESTDQVSALEAISFRMQEIYLKRCQFSNTLADFGNSNDEETVAKRLAVVHELEVLETQYNGLAQKKQQLEAGVLPAVEEKSQETIELPAVDKSALLLQRNNLRSQVSKARTAAQSSSEDVRKAEKLAKLEAELEEVEAQLKLLP